MFFRKSIENSSEKWVIREDRGLSDEERTQLENLKKQNSKFAEDIKSSTAAWDFVKGNSSQLTDEFFASIASETQKRSGMSIRVAGWIAGTAVIACFCVLFVANLFSPEPSQDVAEVIVRNDKPPITKRFDDGSLARMNSGTKLHYEYSEKLRLIHLLEGEAHFAVAKNPQRPFEVCVESITVRAVGTAFNIRKQANGIEVFVTEGKVEVFADKERRNKTELQQSMTAFGASADVGNNSLGFLKGGEKAEIPFEDDSVESAFVMTPKSVETVENEFSWQNTLMTFSGPTLMDLAAEFEQKTGLQLILEDQELESVRIVGGHFSTDEPFEILNLLSRNYGFNWERIDEYTVVISQSKSHQ